jgi:parallel beta-helix repeat protein
VCLSMNKIIVTLALFGLISTSLIMATPTTSSNVITVPDDYPTIDSAIENAMDGDTILLKRGTHQGPLNKTLVINKSITLKGEGSENTIINFDPPMVPMAIFTYNYMGYTYPLKIQADNVEISDLTLNTLGGAISVEGQAIELINNRINTSITVNGIYVKISGNIFHSVTLYGSYHELFNNTLSGVVQSRTSYSTIAANEIIGSSVYGQIIIEGNSNIIYGNRINTNDGVGITLRLNANETIVAKNYITGCVGIRMEWASNSLISANTIKDSNYTAIDLLHGNNNILSGNHVENTWKGIKVGYDQSDISRKGGPKADNNIIFHNNFISNSQQGLDWNWLGTNHWDSGGEGNYWSDYNGSDWNFDGIGDSAYILEEAKSHYAETTRGIDHHPLMAPFNIEGVRIELPEWAPSVSEELALIPAQELISAHSNFIPMTTVATIIVAMVASIVLLSNRRHKKKHFIKQAAIK